MWQSNLRASKTSSGQSVQSPQYINISAKKMAQVGSQNQEEVEKNGKQNSSVSRNRPSSTFLNKFGVQKTDKSVKHLLVSLPSGDTQAAPTIKQLGQTTVGSRAKSIDQTTQSALPFGLVRESTTKKVNGNKMQPSTQQKAANGLAYYKETHESPMKRKYTKNSSACRTVKKPQTSECFEYVTKPKVCQKLSKRTGLNKEDDIDGELEFIDCNNGATTKCPSPPPEISTPKLKTNKSGSLTSSFQQKMSLSKNRSSSKRSNVSVQMNQNAKPKKLFQNLSSVRQKKSNGTNSHQMNKGDKGVATSVSGRQLSKPLHKKSDSFSRGDEESQRELNTSKENLCRTVSKQDSKRAQIAPKPQKLEVTQMSQKKPEMISIFFQDGNPENELDSKEVSYSVFKSATLKSSSTKNTPQIDQRKLKYIERVKKAEQQLYSVNEQIATFDHPLIESGIEKDFVHIIETEQQQQEPESPSPQEFSFNQNGCIQSNLILSVNLCDTVITSEDNDKKIQIQTETPLKPQVQMSLDQQVTPKPDSMQVKPEVNNGFTDIKKVHPRAGSPSKLRHKAIAQHFAFWLKEEERLYCYSEAFENTDFDSLFDKLPEIFVEQYTQFLKQCAPSKKRLILFACQMQLHLALACSIVKNLSISRQCSNEESLMSYLTETLKVNLKTIFQNIHQSFMVLIDNILSGCSASFNANAQFQYTLIRKIISRKLKLKERQNSLTTLRQNNEINTNHLRKWGLHLGTQESNLLSLRVFGQQVIEVLKMIFLIKEVNLEQQVENIFNKINQINQNLSKKSAYEKKTFSYKRTKSVMKSSKQTQLGERSQQRPQKLSKQNTIQFKFQGRNINNAVSTERKNGENPALNAILTENLSQLFQQRRDQLSEAANSGNNINNQVQNINVSGPIVINNNININTSQPFGFRRKSNDTDTEIEQITISANYRSRKSSSKQITSVDNLDKTGPSVEDIKKRTSIKERNNNKNKSMFQQKQASSITIETGSKKSMHIIPEMRSAANKKSGNLPQYNKSSKTPQNMNASKISQGIQKRIDYKDPSQQPTSLLQKANNGLVQQQKKQQIQQDQSSQSLNVNKQKSQQIKPPTIMSSKNNIPKPTKRAISRQQNANQQLYNTQQATNKLYKDKNMYNLNKFVISKKNKGGTVPTSQKYSNTDLQEQIKTPTSNALNDSERAQTTTQFITEDTVTTESVISAVNQKSNRRSKQVRSAQRRETNDSKSIISKIDILSTSHKQSSNNSSFLGSEKQRMSRAERILARAKSLDNNNVSVDKIPIEQININAQVNQDEVVMVIQDTDNKHKVIDNKPKESEQLSPALEIISSPVGVREDDQKEEAEPEAQELNTDKVNEARVNAAIDLTTVTDNDKDQKIISQKNDQTEEESELRNSNQDSSREDKFEAELNELRKLVTVPYLPPMKPNEQKQYTLVLDLDETLIHYQYKKGSYSHYNVRPGCLRFLHQLSKYYEIVIFTAAMPDYADWILNELDEYNLTVKHRLYRQHTQPKEDFAIKDLNLLGRPIEKTIIIDNLKENFDYTTPDNGIWVESWYEDMEDNVLNLLIPFLKEIVEKKIPDVRTVLTQERKETSIYTSLQEGKPIASLDEILLI